jgi:hypothetical protein
MHATLTLMHNYAIGQLGARSLIYRVRGLLGYAVAVLTLSLRDVLGCPAVALGVAKLARPSSLYRSFHSRIPK